MNAGEQVVLDHARDGSVAVFSNPSRVITATALSDVPAALAAMQYALASGHYLAGYFSYELGYTFEPRLAKLLPDNRAIPLLWFGQFDGPPRLIDGTDAAALWPNERVYATPLTVEWDRETYRSRFDAIMRAIRAGDTYQVNLTMRARFRLTGNPRALFGQLRSRAGIAHSAFIDDGERQLLSFSPELFFTMDAQGKITTRPMKGTARRGVDEATDRALRDGLRASRKDRAENLMIVDLIRNDLGKLAKTGSVEVPEIFTIETYPTVHQMTSTVQASVRPGCGIVEILQALFPCGSVTGAPKIRSMQIIRELEDSPRGAYCGSIGMFAPDGSAYFNVAIRTLTVSNGVGELGIGGAVVNDSEADQEYDECLLKARHYETARHTLALIETMAYKEGMWPRRDRHLRRMRDSAKTLGIPFDMSRAVETLQAAAAASNAPICRMRLRLQEDGALVAEVHAMPQRVEPFQFLVSGRRVCSNDPLNRHKTDWRDVYEEEYAWAKARGADEAIFLNERGEICEGTRTNVFIERGGRLLTPPLSSGALGGCLRAELLASGQCEEAVLTMTDLQRADRVFLGNSLRGLVGALPHPGDDPATLESRAAMN